MRVPFVFGSFMRWLGSVEKVDDINPLPEGRGLTLHPREKLAETTTSEIEVR
jgi:hypothetical protein